MPTLLGELPSPGAVSMDASFAYVVSPPSGLVSALALDGTSTRTLAVGQDAPLGIAAADAYVYWTNTGQAAPGAVLAVAEGGRTLDGPWPRASCILEASRSTPTARRCGGRSPGGSARVPPSAER